MNQKTASIGIIGAGGIAGSVHLPSLAEMPQVEIRAICDVRPERMHAMAERYNIAGRYENYHEMLSKEQLDGVFVLVQPEQIFRIAGDCLAAGCHVFVEKPAGITLFQSKSLEEQAKAANRCLQVGMNRRHIPLVKAVLTRMNALTEITQIEGCFVKHGDASFYGGCASAYFCDTIHAIDLVRTIVGADAAAAATVVAQVDSPVETAWNSVIRFQNGVTGILKANYQTGGRVHTFELHGKEASAYINLGFGGERCTATILINEGAGTHSLSAAGSGGFTMEELDGIEIAKSAEYHRYYGYYEEDRLFVEMLLTGDRSACEESGISSFVQSMALAEYLYHSRI